MVKSIAKMNYDEDRTVPWKPLLLIFSAALVVRIAAMLVLQSWHFDSEWEFGYELGRLGRALASGNGFILYEGQPPSATFPPVYPLIMAAFFWIFGISSQASAVGILVFQSFCAGVAAVLLFIIGMRLWGAQQGLVAASIWAVYPSSIYFSLKLVWYCELAIMLVLIAVVIAVSARPPARFSRAACFGAISGVIILTDPSMAIYLAFLLLWMLRIQATKLPRLVGLLLAAGIALIVVVSPWAVHNWVFLGSPRIVKSNFGEALFLGNNPIATGANTADERAQAYKGLDREELNYYGNQPELVRDRYFMLKAFEWMEANPLRFAQFTANRISYFWGINPSVGPRSAIRLVYFAPLLVLSLIGLWICIRRGWHAMPVWLFILMHPIPFYISHVGAGRYSYSVEPFVLLLASVPLAIWLGRIWQPGSVSQRLRHIHKSYSVGRGSA
jgi:4-amino-4-deoxy-L-arabinose transferase-like glycosyltransferase